MASDKIQTLVNYYLREGYVRQVQSICNEVLRKRTNDPLPLFWRAFSLILEGSYTEALRELQPLQSSPEVGLAALAAMVQAHKSAKIVDDEAVLDLTTRLEVQEAIAPEQALLQLATYHWHTKSCECARGLVERALRSSLSATPATLSLLGWIILSDSSELATEHRDQDSAGLADDHADVDEALGYFERALQQAPTDLEALLGKAKCLERGRAWASAQSVLSEVSVRYPWFLLAHMEQARLLLAAGDWEQALEHAALTRQQDPHNIEALHVTAVHMIAHRGQYAAAEGLLGDLLAAVERQEPKTATLYHRLALPYVRLAGRDTSILGASLAFAERAAQLAPENPSYAVEVGRIKMLMGDYASAAERFRFAAHMDELHVGAMHGNIECDLLTGHVADAESHLEFLVEMGAAASVKQPIEQLFLQALLSIQTAEPSAELLEKAVQAHSEALSELPGGLHFLCALNATRLLGAARLFMQLAGSSPQSATEPVSPLLTKCRRVLELVGKHAPGLAEAQLLLAQVHFLSGHLDTAQRKAADILLTNPVETAAHLLISDIFLHEGKPAAAMEALDQAVSASFAVREAPAYACMRARALLALDRVEEATRMLEAAMAMPGVKRAMSQNSRKRLTGKRVVEPSVAERVTIYLLLAQVLNTAGKVPEATKVMQDALREFKGTSEEVRITIANSDLAVARGDIAGALQELRAIPKESPFFLKARIAVANIYLHHKKDKAAYARCYSELAEKYGDYDSYRVLGEALMQIQEPEKAIKAFESALEKNPKDAELASKIGRALVLTHDYRRALDYYNKAVRNNPNNADLHHELATLLIRLRQWDTAEKLLGGCLERSGAGGVESQAAQVKSHTLLAQVHKGRGNNAGYEAALRQAMRVQEELLGALRGEHADLVMAQQEAAADMAYELGQFCEAQRDMQQAGDLYDQAIRLFDGHKAGLALAQLHLAQGDTERCQEACAALLQTNPEQPEAQMIMAEVMCHQENYESAAYHFQQLLDKQPDRYSALAQLIMLLWRSGRLADVPQYIQAAEASAARSANAPGLHYCKGLHARRCNNTRDALRGFNAARKDTEWGPPAAFQMVDIYLQPEIEAMWAEEGSGAKAGPNAEAIEAAKRLLREVRVTDRLATRHQVLKCYATMATGVKADVESAVAQLLDLASADRDNVSVLFALASGFMLLKQTPKARNQLKRIQKIKYLPDQADDCERAWLLLADIHIQGGKFDLAQELCKKCLKHNASCAKAWESLGAILEREQAYKDAAEQYEHAWRHESEASPAIGYKLAFNYLKARRFVDAIDVCHKVLKAYPEYPKIRKDILDKARANLRP
ncbi:hypothetical protein WJX72_006291 [[Myrmecia] bisecta]|uniref:Tetratricopeptide repeat protein 21B n=1 Tax=[Myrmecia] bisecta TaxID=41462 RepID=A0AAW1R7K5_9CHLO